MTRKSADIRKMLDLADKYPYKFRERTIQRYSDRFMKAHAKRLIAKRRKETQNQTQQLAQENN